MPPDPQRLDGLYWIGHTTHSHTFEAPRWRVVIPPEAAELLQRLGPAAPPPRTPSTVEPYRAQVEHLLEAGVEQMTIFHRLRERGYTGSYSSIRRFVRTLRPVTPKAVVRVHTTPGEEAQVDFGSAGVLHAV